MNKTIFIELLFISLVSGVVSYFATNNFIIAVVVLVIYVIYSFIADNFLIKQYQIKNKKLHEQYNFINSFIFTLSVTNSIKSSFSSATLYVTGDLKDEITHIEEQDAYEKVKYLAHYFNFDVYQVFLNLLSTYINEGGDILLMSDLLRKELIRIENDLIEFENKSKSKLVEFIILWTLTYIILIFVRLALKEYFLYIVQNNLYTISIFVFFLLALCSFHFFLSFLTGEKIKFRRIKR